SAEQCHLPVPISATHQCQSVPPISAASQCPPNSAIYQCCCLSVPISDACQCHLPVPSHQCHLPPISVHQCILSVAITTASLAHISEGENHLFTKFY
ncbi:unnamed protein product, partial [Staurois parvus]